MTATSAVIVIHVAAQNWDATGIETFEWNVFNFYDSIARWAGIFWERERSILLILLYQYQLLAFWFL